MDRPWASRASSSGKPACPPSLWLWCVCLTDTDCTLTATLMSTRAIFARASLIALHTRLVYLCSSHSPWLSGALLTSCESHSQADFNSAPVFRQRRIQVYFLCHLCDLGSSWSPDHHGHTSISIYYLFLDFLCHPDTSSLMHASCMPSSAWLILSHFYNHYFHLLVLDLLPIGSIPPNLSHDTLESWAWGVAVTVLFQSRLFKCWVSCLWMLPRIHKCRTQRRNCRHWLWIVVADVSRSKARISPWLS